jgi:hypothetical protein
MKQTMPNEGDRIELIEMAQLKGYLEVAPGSRGTVFWTTTNIIYVDWDMTHDKVALVKGLDKWRILEQSPK